MTITLSNARLASLWPRKLVEANVTIDHGRIMRIGKDMPENAGSIVDCTGKLVIPGNVCAHTHLYSALARGMPPPQRQPQNFVEILELVWWRLDRALDEQSVRSSVLAGALDAIRAGTTTLVDHHSSPNYIHGSLDTIADALEHVGVRGVLCYEVTDRNGREGREAGLGENERFLGTRRPRIRGLVGAHASFTLEDDTLTALANLAAAHDTGVHIHVAEDLADEEDSIRRCGRRVVERLESAGMLRPQSILAHCIHLDDHELRIAQKRQPWLVHNCRSNMNNSVGRAPVGRFGTRSALGTDGIDQDMFAESRTAFFRAREESLEATADATASALARGAALAAEIFGVPIGSLEPGAAADLVVLDYAPPTPLTEGNLAWHWMFALTAGNVESVMVDGDWVLRDRQFVAVDEEKIRAEADGEARRLWAAMEAL
jgi:putative selenium metabolism protein SsnA